jgi:hypothetical protein
MKLLHHLPIHQYVPFQLRTAFEDDTHWIGGDAPMGISPPIVHPVTRHLATLQLFEDESVILFSSFDFKASSGPLSFGAGSHLLHDGQSTLVQCIQHRTRRPAAKTEFWAGFGPVGLEFGSAQQETQPDPYDDHKTGGYPFVQYVQRGFERAMQAALEDGYCHVMQLAFPGFKDVEIDADWPFGSRVFHLFGKSTGRRIEFRSCWG